MIHIAAFICLVLLSLDTLKAQNNCDPLLYGIGRGGLKSFDPYTQTFDTITSIFTASGRVEKNALLNGKYYFSDARQKFFEVDLSSGETTNEYPFRRIDFYFIEPDPCSQKLYGFATNLDTNPRRIEFKSLDPATGEFEVIAHPIDGFAGSSSRKHFIQNETYYFHDVGKDSLIAIDLYSGQVVDRIGIGNNSLDLLNAVADPGSDGVYGLSKDEDDLYFVRLDLDSKTIERVTPVAMPFRFPSSNTVTIVDGIYYCYESIENHLYGIDIETGTIVLRYNAGQNTFNFIEADCSCRQKSLNVVPTLSEWSMIILFLLLAIFSVVTISTLSIQREMF